MARRLFTGKERDAESGLDFFGARYIASAQGRFASADPSNLSVDFWLPQTWNRYSYALNNPLSMVDRNGLWPWWVHNEIISQAFPGLSPADLKALTDASWNMDYGKRTELGLGPQDPASSALHGMIDATDPDPAHALWLSMTLGDRFIDDQMAKARAAQAAWIASGHKGLSPQALTAFGNALHTVTDRTSPAHAGYQKWRGTWAYFGLPALVHGIRESFATTQELQNAISAAQGAFNDTFLLPSWQSALIFGLPQQPPPTPSVTSTICYESNGQRVCQ
jgi:RHS repeat-associated protein